MLRLHPTSHPDGRQGSVLLMPPPRRALRHALPVVLEGVVGPLIVFYLLLVVAGFRGALDRCAHLVLPCVGSATAEA